MGIVHRATLSPTKQELVESWLPSRSWGGVITDKLGEYRLDDPAGEIGVETILWRTEDDRILQTPLTYRSEPLAGADAFLLGTSEHSVLGTRWVYDGCGDPVWAATLVAAILTGGTQSQMYIEVDGERIDVPARMEVGGSGEPGAVVPAIEVVDSVSDDGMATTVTAGRMQLLLPRVIGTDVEGAQLLTGRFTGSDEPLTLAALRT